MNAEVKGLPGETQTVTVFGVEYLHLRLPHGDDIYVTEYGMPFVLNLLPENHWSDSEWFQKNSRKLFGHDHRSGGTSTIYRVRTKEVQGLSKEIVLKWNRMGQDVPGIIESADLSTAEFNSPYEEFALLLEMRNAWTEAGTTRILTHKPLAIYVPVRKLDPARSGRNEHKMLAKITSHPEIPLDMFRPYAVIYEWIKGIDLAEARYRELIDEKTMRDLTLLAENDLLRLGFRVRDRKPQHVIVRIGADRALQKDAGGRVPYALVDFELLERTPEREESVKKAKRRQYLQRQAHRFEESGKPALPPHLRHIRLLGTDYVFGQAESTGGRLWVVGNDPALFDYFLPERWEHTPRTRLSHSDEIYETTTKDNVHVVWKLSRVGWRPDMDPFRPEEQRILEHGYNSPFEEVAFALELGRAGIPTTLPRAIYETGHVTQQPSFLLDKSRYDNPALMLPDGTAALMPDRDYVVIWGYWNKPDELLAIEDRDYYYAIDALQALRENIIDDSTYAGLMQSVKDKLMKIRMEHLDLRGIHELLSLNTDGKLILDATGLPEVRLCNFELLKRIDQSKSSR